MLELYKAYIADLGNIGGRYTTANGFYLSVVTALIAVLALGETDKPLADLRIGLVPVLCGVGVVVCWIWHRTITFYGRLFLAKFDTLREMEKQLPFAVYEFEFARIKAHKAGSLTKRERLVPLALGLMFAVIGVSALWAALGA